MALAGLVESVSTLSERVAELSESVITPGVALRLESCGRSMSLLSFVHSLVVNTTSFMQCSAVPMPREALVGLGLTSSSSSMFFLSAAHCYASLSTFVLTGNRTQIVLRDDTGAYVEHECHLHSHFLSEHTETSFDLAIIACQQPLSVSPTQLFTESLVSSLPVVITGFSSGVHFDAIQIFRKNFIDSDGENRTEQYAPHSQFSRLSSSMQTPYKDVTVSDLFHWGFIKDEFDNAHCSPADCVPLAHPTLQVGSSAAKGFTIASPQTGMSGGAVLDMHCRLIGVTELRVRYGQGGQFVRLLPFVIARIAGSLSRDWEGFIV